MKAFPHKRIEEYEYEAVGQLTKENRTMTGKREVFDSGMDLRDFFASKAMQSFLVAKPDGIPHEIAEDSYVIADAMMVERGK